MKTKQMGRTGLKVSEICLGTMTFGLQCDEPASVAIMDTAAEYGVDFFDTSDAYPLGGNLSTIGRTEEIIGRWLKGRREKIVLATKCFAATGPAPNQSGLSRKHICEAVEASLRRLQTDYIDLYQLHGFDAQTPAEEVMSTLDDLVRAGKIRYIGVSNFSGWHLMKSLAVADRYGYARYVANQTYYSLIGRQYEWELMPLGLDQGVGAVVWSPLGWGRLTGKIRRNAPLPETSRLHKTAAMGPQMSDEYLHKVVDALDAVSAETGKSVPQIALNWLLQRPTVSTVIIGARDEKQLRDNLGALGWSLTKEQIAMLDAASDEPLAYPYWHQRSFAERNPPPIPIASTR
jgi:aryl-alcohol dehydrogenase-like predicted oxidoreductase